MAHNWRWLSLDDTAVHRDDWARPFVGSVVTYHRLSLFTLDQCFLAMSPQWIPQTVILLFTLFHTYHIMRLHSFLLSFSVTLAFVPLDHWALVSRSKKSSSSTYHRSKVSPASNSSTVSYSSSSHPLVRSKRKWMCTSVHQCAPDDALEDEWH